MFATTRRHTTGRSALALNSSIATLLGLAALLPQAQATDGTWTQVGTGNQAWATTTNWTGGIVADAVDGNAIFNVDLTNDQTITLGGAGRTIGNLFFQDTATGTAGGYGIGTAGDGALTLDVSSGRSVVDIGALNGGTGAKKVAVLVPIINSDGVMRIGPGQLSIRTDSPNFTGDLVAAGGLTDTRSFLSNLSALRVLAGATFQIDFVNNGGTNVQNLINVNAPLTLGGAMVTPRATIPPTLPLANTVLNFGNSTFTLTGKAGSANVQSFASTTLSPGFNTINLNTGAAGTSVTLNLGGITRNAGSLVNFVVPAAGTTGIATTTTANTGDILGGWATVNGADWATVSGGTISALAAGSYAANNWGAGLNTDVQANIAAASGATQSVRFNTAAATTVTLTGPSVITSGGILINAVVAANACTITGGTLTSNSGDLIMNHNGTGTLTINSQIVETNGSVGLTKNGAGPATLTSVTSLISGPVNVMGGSLTFAGNVTGGSPLNIAAGATLTLGAGGTTGTFGNVAINNNGTFAINRSDNLTLSNTLTGTGAFTKSGNGVLTLVNPTPWTGTTNHNAGVIALAADGVLPSGNFRFNLAGATLRSADANLRTVTNFFDIATDAVFGGTNTGDLLLTGTFATGSGAKTLTINNTTTTVSGQVTGGASTNFVTKAGPGTLVWSNATNTLNRPVSINAGTLQISAEENLGVNPSTAAANNLQLNGGTLRTTATFTIDDAARGVTITSSGGAFSPDAATTLTVANVIAGPGALTKTGSGTLALVNTNTYTGGTIVQSGTVSVGVTGSIASSANFDVRAGATLDISATTGLAVSGTQSLLGSGTVLGNVAVSAGGLVTPGAFNTVGTLSVTGNVSLDNANLTYNLGANSTPGGTFNDLLNITGGLSLTGINTVQIAATEGLAGTYRLMNYTPGSLTGGLANLSVSNGGARYTVTPNFATPGQVNLVVTGSIANLTWIGDGIGNIWDLNTTANFNNNSQTFFQQDKVTFDDSTTNTSIFLLDAVTPSSITFNTAASTYQLTGSGRITGATSITKNGTGTVTISTVNDGYGAVTINSGTLVLDFSATLGSGPVNIAGGTLALSTPASNTTGPITIGAAGTLRFDGAATDPRNVTDNGIIVLNNAVTLSGVISGTGGINASFNGATQLTGTAANTYTGLTTVSAGTLTLNKTAGINAIGGDVLVNGGTMAWSATTTDQVADTSSITVTSGALATGNRADTIANLTISSPTLSTVSGLTVTGTATISAGTQDVTNTNGTFTANTLILSGGSNSRLGANGGTSVVNVGTGGLTMNGATIQFGNPGAATSLALLNLNGNATFSGTNLFEIGTNNAISEVNLGSATRTFLVSDGVTTVKPAIVGGTPTTGLTKTGNGVLVLAAGTNGNGASTYKGDTNVNAGVLRVNGSLSGTNVTVTGGTLEGTGSITTGSLGLTLNAGGKLAPGTSTSVGTLTVSAATGGLKLSGAVTTSGSGALLFDLATPGTSDQVVLTAGSLNIGTNVLEFNDFTFTSLGGIANGSTYVLFDGISPITGTLGAVTTGTVGGFPVQLQFADNGNDLVLTTVPEPGTALMLLGGLAMMGARRRRRA